jgi:hypothetical protein
VPRSTALQVSNKLDSIPIVPNPLVDGSLALLDKLSRTYSTPFISLRVTNRLLTPTGFSTKKNSEVVILNIQLELFQF